MEEEKLQPYQTSNKRHHGLINDEDDELPLATVPSTTSSSTGTLAVNHHDNTISSASTTTTTSQSDIQLEIENSKEIAPSYVRTRHKNMRCFPKCSSVHKTKSFCGHSLYVSVKGKVFRKEDVILLGEFRNTRLHPSFSLNQMLESTEFSEQYTEGVLLQQENDHMQFAINPSRKWKFEGKLRPMDHYVFTVFLIVQSKVLALKDTPSFSIIPIWRTPENCKGDEEEEEETSMSVAPTRKKPTQSNPHHLHPPAPPSTTQPPPQPQPHLNAMYPPPPQSLGLTPVPLPQNLYDLANLYNMAFYHPSYQFSGGVPSSGKMNMANAWGMHAMGATTSGTEMPPGGIITAMPSSSPQIPGSTSTASFQAPYLAQYTINRKGQTKSSGNSS